jgi:hypothetical protein
MIEGRDPGFYIVFGGGRGAVGDFAPLDGIFTFFWNSTEYNFDNGYRVSVNRDFQLVGIAKKYRTLRHYVRCIMD